MSVVTGIFFAQASPGARRPRAPLDAAFCCCTLYWVLTPEVGADDVVTDARLEAQRRTTTRAHYRARHPSRSRRRRCTSTSCGTDSADVLLTRDEFAATAGCCLAARGLQFIPSSQGRAI